MSYYRVRVSSGLGYRWTGPVLELNREGKKHTHLAGYPYGRGGETPPDNVLESYWDWEVSPYEWAPAYFWDLAKQYYYPCEVRFGYLAMFNPVWSRVEIAFPVSFGRNVPSDRPFWADVRIKSRRYVYAGEQRILGVEVHEAPLKYPLRAPEGYNLQKKQGKKLVAIGGESFYSETHPGEGRWVTPPQVWE